jgi:hypothetical protein
MMATQQKTERKEIQVTPPGIALFPRLNEPDEKFNENGVYYVKLRLTAEDAAPIIAACDAIAEDAFQNALSEAKTERERKKVKLADPAYIMEEDDSGNETGNVIFNFKMTASGVSKKSGKPWTRTCPVFDAKQTPVDLSRVKIGGGSVVRVAYVAYGFYTAALGAGVSLRLEAVQVLELKEWGSKDASAFGFDVADGYATEAAPFDDGGCDDGEGAYSPSDSGDY